MILLELLLEGGLQAVLEVLVELGIGPNELRSRGGRRLLLAIIGFVGGLLWAGYLHDTGNTAMPRTLWVSLALAAGAVAAGWWRRSAGGGAVSALRGGLLPWHWPAERWDTFAILNAAVAVGVVAGFR